MISKCGKRFFADLIFFDIELNAPFAVLKLDKSGFAKGSARQNAAGHAYVGISGIDLFYGAVGGNDVGRGMLRLEVIGVGIYARFPERIYLASSLEQEFTEFFHDSDSTFHNKYGSGNQADKTIFNVSVRQEKKGPLSPPKGEASQTDCLLTVS